MRNHFKTQQEAGVICDINTTPMIDILLVLIIMLIITLPEQSHKIAIDMPGGTVIDAAPPPVHRLAISQTGSYTWDGAPLTAASLPATLKAHVDDPLGPVLQLQTDPSAPYLAFNDTLAVVKRAGVTKIGFVGNPTSF